MRKIAMFPRGDVDSSCRRWDFAAERSDVKSHEPKMANGVRHPPPLFSCFRAGAGLERVGSAASCSHVPDLTMRDGSAVFPAIGSYTRIQSTYIFTGSVERSTSPTHFPPSCMSSRK